MTSDRDILSETARQWRLVDNPGGRVNKGEEKRRGERRERDNGQTERESRRYMNRGWGRKTVWTTIPQRQILKQVPTDENENIGRKQKVSRTYRREI